MPQSLGKILQEDACIISNGTTAGYLNVKIGSDIFNYEYVVIADDKSKKLPNLVVIHGAVKTVLTSNKL